MIDFNFANQRARLFADVGDEQALWRVLEHATGRMGFRYFALTQHAWRAPQRALRLHTYPTKWEKWYDAHELGPSDPIHRASQRRCAGFTWADLPRLISLTPADFRVLTAARSLG